MEIRLFGKNILRFYSHHIMEISYADAKTGLSEDPELALEKIDPDRFSEIVSQVGSTVTTANLRRLIAANGERCEGFVLKRQGKPVGTAWVLYKGADDLEYRIRSIDAYLFGVYVNEAWRGRGYAGAMLRRVAEYLHGRGIDRACLTVSVSNESAIRAYEKTGFRTIYDRKFARFLKMNIPYHAL